MRLRHIEIFNAVLSAGTVSGAAKLLNLTQPAVSRTLQHAELQLGVALFHRSKGKLIPTPDAVVKLLPLEPALHVPLQAMLPRSKAPLPMVGEFLACVRRTAAEAGP